MAQATRAELEATPDIGAVMAQSVHDFFRLPHNKELLVILQRQGLNFGERDGWTKPTTMVLAGQRWVVTGTLSCPRDEMTELIRRHGGTISGSVSKKTSFVLAGEEAGSKLEKAIKLGIPTISEKELRKKIT